MSDYASEIARKTISAEAAAMVEPGMWVDIGGANAQPEVFDKALAERVSHLTDLRVRTR